MRVLITPLKCLFGESYRPLIDLVHGMTFVYKPIQNIYR